MNGELFGHRSVQHCVPAAIDCNAIQRVLGHNVIVLQYVFQCNVHVHCAVMLLRSAEQWLKLVAAGIILAARVFNAFQNNHIHDGDDDDDLRRILMTNNDPVVVVAAVVVVVVVVVVSGSVADYYNCYLYNSTFIFTGGQL